LQSKIGNKFHVFATLDSRGGILTENSLFAMMGQFSLRYGLRLPFVRAILQRLFFFSWPWAIVKSAGKLLSLCRRSEA
jgi:hypothetical protein